MILEDPDAEANGTGQARSLVSPPDDYAIRAMDLAGNLSLSSAAAIPKAEVNPSRLPSTENTARQRAASALCFQQPFETGRVNG
jgi:hypothetical protein